MSNIIIGDLDTLPFQAAIRKIKDQGYSDVQQTLNLMPQELSHFFQGYQSSLKLIMFFTKQF